MLIILGKHGQVAVELQKAAQLKGIPYQAFSSSEADLKSPDTLIDFLSKATEPLVVVNAAAYTQVDLAETNEDEALQINAIGPSKVAEVCRDRGHTLIQISTDYVFAGDHPAPYTEADETNPQGVYGKTKLEGERLILEALPSAIIVRTSWVFSAHGKNFVKTMLRLAKDRDTLGVVCDQHGSPTSAASIAQCCLAIASAVQNVGSEHSFGGIYHFSSHPTTTWHGFAEEIFRQAGLSVKVNEIPTSAYPTPAKRPANSRLNCDKISSTFAVALPDWKKDLADVLQELNQAES
jgi:dTDP-4-dehydrorhamnose reductase